MSYLRGACSEQIGWAEQQVCVRDVAREAVSTLRWFGYIEMTGKRGIYYEGVSE